MTVDVGGDRPHRADSAAVALPRWVQRISWLVVLVFGVAAYLIVLRTMINTENLNLFPALLFIGALTVPLTVLAFALVVGDSSGVPGWAVVTSAVVGGLVGIVAASALEYDTMQRLGALPMLFVGIIEEASKLLVPLLLFVLLRPRDPRGGVIIGIASGMGFAVLETMGYGFQALLSAKSVAAVDGTLLLRALLSPACHIAWTGMTVAMLWRIRSSHHRVRAGFAFLATYLAAVVLHATWDGSSSRIVYIIVAAIGLVVLLIFIFLAHRRRDAKVH